MRRPLLGHLFWIQLSNVHKIGFYFLKKWTPLPSNNNRAYLINKLGNGHRSLQKDPGHMSLLQDFCCGPSTNLPEQDFYYDCQSGYEINLCDRSEHWEKSGSTASPGWPDWWIIMLMNILYFPFLELLGFERDDWFSFPVFGRYSHICQDTCIGWRPILLPNVSKRYSWYRCEEMCDLTCVELRMLTVFASFRQPEKYSFVYVILTLALVNRI